MSDPAGSGIFIAKTGLAAERQRNLAARQGLLYWHETIHIQIDEIAFTPHVGAAWPVTRWPL
jgi:hypothetical protein